MDTIYAMQNAVFSGGGLFMLCTTRYYWVTDTIYTMHYAELLGDGYYLYYALHGIIGVGYYLYYALRGNIG